MQHIVYNALVMETTTTNNRPTRCQWCGHSDRYDRGTVHTYDSGEFHSGCHYEHEQCEQRKAARQVRTASQYERERRAHSQLMDIAAGYSD